MSTILTSTGITFPDGSTQSTVANTPFVACKAILPYAGPGTQISFPTGYISPTYEIIPINTRDTSLPNYSSFDTTNHWFVAPNAGLYFVSAAVYVNNGGGSAAIYDAYCGIAVNGTVATAEAIYQNQGYVYTQVFWRKTAGVFSLNSGDKVTVMLAGASSNWVCYCTSCASYLYVNYAAIEVQQIRY